jgi:hypothetical protein
MCECCSVHHSKKNADTADLRDSTDLKKALAYAVRSVGGCFCVQDLVNLFLIYQIYSGERAYFIFVERKKA